MFANKAHAGHIVGWLYCIPATGCIARHSESLASSVVAAGTVPLLVLCIQEPEINIKRSAAAALGDIAKHSQELAQVRQLDQNYMNSAKQEKKRESGQTAAMTVNKTSIYWCAILLSQVVCDAGAVPLLSKQLGSTDAAVRRQARLYAYFFKQLEA